MEALKSLCDGLSLQVTDVQQKLGAVGTLQRKLLPLTTQIATLKGQIDKVQGRSRRPGKTRLRLRRRRSDSRSW